MGASDWAGRVTAFKESRGNVREQAVPSILCLNEHSSLNCFFLEVTTIDTSGSIIEQEKRTRSCGGWNENDDYNSRLCILFHLIAFLQLLSQNVLIVELAGTLLLLLECLSTETLPNDLWWNQGAV